MTDFQKGIVRFMYSALVVAAAVALFGLLSRGGPTTPKDYGYGVTPGVSASGSCIVRAKPDVANVRIAVSQSANTADGADREVRTRVAKIAAGLKAGGVDAKNIRTERYRLFSTWKAKYHVMAWTADEVLDVRMTDLTKVPALLDTALKAGATGINGLSFEASNINELRASGRAKAAREARRKAAGLASSLGGRLGKLVACTENYPAQYGSANAMVKSAVAYRAAREGRSPTVEPGELAVTVVVKATYDLR